MTFVLVLVVFFSLKNHEYVHTIMICHVIMSMLLHVHQILTVIERTADCFGTWHFKKWTIPNSFKWWWTTLGCSCQNWTKNECRRNRAKKKKRNSYSTGMSLHLIFLNRCRKKVNFQGVLCFCIWRESCTAAEALAYPIILLTEMEHYLSNYPIMQLHE